MSSITNQSVQIDFPEGTLELTWAAVTDTGRRREINQDALLAQYPLFAVADGMGGHIGGEIASSSTINQLRVMLDGSVDDEAISEADISLALGRAVQDIAAHPEATDEGTGTTLTGVFLDRSDGVPRWTTMNIGDSRVYLLREGNLVQLTTDHSVVQELIDSGRLSPEEAESHPYGNVITRAVGPTESVAPDYVRVDVNSGDRFVVCSDGLTKELTDYGLQHFLTENPEPAVAVQAMLDAALENGGRDNVTLIVLDVTLQNWDATASGASEDPSSDDADPGNADQDDDEDTTEVPARA